MGAIPALMVLVIGLVAAAAMLADPVHATPPLLGDAPAMRISNLPNINETAFVEITYTDVFLFDAYPPSRGWSVSPNLEIVDSYGVPYRPVYDSAADNLRRHMHAAHTPLERGESITYNIEIRAVSEGRATIAAWGHVDTGHIVLYLDSYHTMLYDEYRRLHPEPRAPPPQPRDDGEGPRYIPLTEEQSQALSREQEIDSTMGSIAAHIQREGHAASEAVDFFIAGTRAFTMPQIQHMLDRAGFAGHDVNAALSPGRQLQMQIPTDQVQCRNEMLLMQSPSGRPACVFGASLEKLERRGFVLLDTVRNWSSICPTEPSAASVYSESRGTPPRICMSNLPSVGETATVKIGYTNDQPISTAGRQERSYPGWQLSPNFEIVDSHGMPYRTVYHPGTDTVIDYRHVSDMHLESGESITYDIEVRAVREGPAMITGWGHFREDAGIMLYLDTKETMFYQEHRDLHPEAYLRDAGLMWTP